MFRQTIRESASDPVTLGLLGLMFLACIAMLSLPGARGFGAIGWMPLWLLLWPATALATALALRSRRSPPDPARGAVRRRRVRPVPRRSRGPARLRRTRAA